MQLDLLDGPPPPPDKPADDMSADELAQAVRYHGWRYFSLNAPSISDYEFDRLVRRLETVAPDHPALQELVGADQGEKVKHDAPMLSLDKCYTEEELLGWIFDKRNSRGERRFAGPVIETPKVDGVAASFRYDATGRLVAAVTRGDGVQGESFLPNARNIAAIPRQIPEGPAELRGELYMKLSVFADFRETFSNPRNTTAGAIKQKDARVTAKYRLSFFAYDVLGRSFATEMDKAAWVKAQGFEGVPCRQLEVGEIQAGYEAWLTRRGEVDYETDGVVYKVDRTDEQRRMGVTAHHPRYAIAYKFQGDSGVTTLEDVEWSVSRTGAITPVAIVAPIELSGAMVSRCSLHNISILRALGASYGAHVVAMRRGGVIPHIEAVAKPGDRPIEIPETCPSCGGPTRLDATQRQKRNKDSGAMEAQVFEFLYCAQPEVCPDAIRGTIEHFVKATEIDGFGPKLVAQLLSEGLVREAPDLFRLTADALLPLERMGETLAQKLVDQIQARRELPLGTFLRALGIDELGAVVAGQLAEHCGSLAACRDLRVRDLAGDPEAGTDGLKGFGDKMAESVVDGLTDRSGLIDRLLAFVTVTDHVAEVPTVPMDSDHPVVGRSFVFTGKMATLSRKDAQATVKRLGGQTPSGVSAALDFLVIGDDGSPLFGDGAMSSKHKKAEKLIGAGAEIGIISETRFLEMVEENAS